MLKTLKEIFPPSFLLLVFTPLLVGAFIDLELLSAREFVINLIWIPLFTVSFALSQKRLVYSSGVFLFFIVGLLELCHWIMMKGPITLTSLLVMSNSNFAEAFEFMELKNTLGLLAIIPYTLLFIYCLRNAPSKSSFKYRTYSIGVISIISLAFLFENAVQGRFFRKGSPQIIKVSSAFISKRKLYKEALLETEPKHVQAVATVNIKQCFVLILGESASRRHMGLYNAELTTNPKLSTRDDISVFTDVVSPYSNTLNSVLSILSQSNLEEDINFENGVDIIDVFHAAGFKTYWISNQSPIGVWDNMVTVFAKKSDQYTFVNTSSNSSFEATYTTSYDDKLFEPFAAALAEDHPKKFIVLHLMGSHSSYAKRYPTKFNVYKGNSKKERTIAEYHNSVLYNDFIVDSILNTLQSSKANSKLSLASAIYLSDHGENVYDENENVGHDFTKVLPKVNVEIPFFVWLPSNFKEFDSLKVKSIHDNKSKPFVSDDLFHAILDLNQIESPVFQPQRSVFNEGYNANRLRVLEDGKNYDSD